MPPSREDDLNWLYGDDQAPASTPEPTRVLPTVPSPAAAGPAHPSTPGPLSPAGASAGVPGPTWGAPPSWEPQSWDARGALPPPPTGAPPPLAASGWSGGSGAPPAAPNAPTAPAAPQRPARPPRPRKRRHPVRATLLVLGLVVVLTAGWFVGVPLFAWSHVGRTAYEPRGTRPADQPGTTILLVGSDSRAGLTKAQQKKLGTGSVAGQRTDTIMLLYVPPTGEPALISLPRDSYVAIPGNGMNKINAAYAFGGARLLAQTVEQSTGLRVDAYAEIGFGGFVGIIDALGGIRMCLPAAIKDRDSHLDLPKGCQTLDGVNALGYVRMRKADPRGDLGRVERQRQMVAAVAKKAATPATLLNPVSYWKVTNAGTDALTLGLDTSIVQAGKLALAMKQIAGGKGLTLTVPIANPGASTPVGSAVLWDAGKAKAMFGEIAKGDTSGLDKYVTK